jgi:hypothetical protein
MFSPSILIFFSVKKILDRPQKMSLLNWAIMKSAIFWLILERFACNRARLSHRRRDAAQARTPPPGLSRLSSSRGWWGIKGKPLLLLLFLLPQHPFSIRHHILNGTYVIRGRDGSGSCNGTRLLQQLLADVFHITAPNSPFLCKYLDA